MRAPNTQIAVCTCRTEVDSGSGQSGEAFSDRIWEGRWAQEPTSVCWDGVAQGGPTEGESAVSAGSGRSVVLTPVWGAAINTDRHETVDGVAAAGGVGIWLPTTGGQASLLGEERCSTSAGVVGDVCVVDVEELVARVGNHGEYVNDAVAVACDVREASEAEESGVR